MTIASAAAVQSSPVSTAVTFRSDRSGGNSSFAQILDGASATEDSSVESASQYRSSSAQSTLFDSSTFRSSFTSIRYSSSQSTADETTSGEEAALQANRQSTSGRSTSLALSSRSQTSSSSDAGTTTNQRTTRSSGQSSRSSQDASSSETENTDESSPRTTAANSKDGQPGHGGRKSSSGRGKATAENQANSATASGSNAILTALISQDSQALSLNLQLDAGQADVVQGDATTAGSNSSSNGFAAAVAGMEAGSVTTATQQNDAVPPAESRKSSPTANAEGTAAVPNKTEMAFAARVQAVANASGNATGRHASDTQQSTTASAALRKAAGDAEATADPKDVKAVDAAATNTTASANNAAALFSQNSRLSEVESVAKADTAAPVAETAQVQPETQAKATAPLKDISLHLSQDGAEKVEVRVVQEAGEIRVAVRTGDSELATGLRQGIHELSGKLEDNGYRADTWRPSGQTTTATSPVQAESSSSTSAHSHSGDAESGQQGSHQDSGQRNQNQSNRPRWVEELETSISSGGESTGETNGIVS